MDRVQTLTVLCALSKKPTTCLFVHIFYLVGGWESENQGCLFFKATSLDAFRLNECSGLFVLVVNVQAQSGGPLFLCKYVLAARVCKWERTEVMDNH